MAVSHDRYLLDETVDQIAELSGGRVRLWPGNYSAYTVARELELQRQQQAYVTQQKEIARLEEAIRRFKDWASRVVDERHIKQARNKQRQIDRMDKIDRPVLERRKIALELRPHARGGERVVELAGVGVELAGRAILDDVDLTVLRGERVGVVGDNGAGKSVLLRLLAGELEPTDGERKAGPSIRFGRLAQDRRPDDPQATPLQLVRRAAPISEGEAVSRLMKFLFGYEQVRRPLDTLSGGEWTRLQLLLLMIEGANCLLLDEPTNHLDIESVEMLEGALEAFDGTAIFVSHDRYFLDRIADRIVEVADGARALVRGRLVDLARAPGSDRLACGSARSARGRGGRVDRRRVVILVPVADVEEEALQEQRVILLVAHGDRLVVHPDGASVGGDQAVLHPEVLTGRVRPLDLRDHAIVVVGMQALGEEAGLEPLGDRVAEHRLDPRADVLRRQRDLDRVDVRRERDLLDERAVLRLGRAQALVAIAALRDVADRDGEEQRPGHVDAGDRDLGRERAMVGAEGVDLEPRAEQRAGCRSRRRSPGRRGARVRRRARGTACRPRRRGSSRRSPRSPG